MNGKQAKRLRKEANKKRLSRTATYNLSDEQMATGGQTLYLTTECNRFFYHRLKDKFLNRKRAR